MKTNFTIQVRAFPVTIGDERTKEVRQDTIVLTKEQLQAAQLVGQSAKELIYRIYNRQGYIVGEIGKAKRQTITLNLEELYRLHSVAMMGKREKVEV